MFRLGDSVVEAGNAFEKVLSEIGRAKGRRASTSGRVHVEELAGGVEGLIINTLSVRGVVGTAKTPDTDHIVSGLWIDQPIYMR